MKLNTIHNDYDNSALLQCPVCGGNNLHHGDVTIRALDEEDGPATVVVVDTLAQPTIVKITRGDGGNHRRNSLVISFTCEAGCRFELDIYQHKGSTYLDALPPRKPTLR